jgi:hypothetical protein
MHDGLLAVEVARHPLSRLATAAFGRSPVSGTQEECRSK